MLPVVKQYFDTINSTVDEQWRSRAKQRLRDSARERRDVAEKKLEKLIMQQIALKEEILKSIMGESQFDTTLLNEMMEENKRAQAEAEREIEESKSEAADEQTRVKHLEKQYKDIRSWAAEFDKAPTDARKMILARLIDKITVDREYNIDIHFYVTPEDFEGLATEAS